MPLPIRAIPTQFDPRRIANCNLWIDFSDRSTITLDANSLIEQINDKSDSGLHATQTTASDRPSLSTINGLTCGDWGASSNSKALVNTTSALNFQSATVVGKWDNANDPNSFEGLLSSNTSGILFIAASPSTWFADIYSGNFWLNRSQTDVFLPAMRTAACVVQGHRTSSVSLSGFCIGHDRRGLVGSRGWEGRICEVVCYSRQITTEERNWLAYAIAGKWGIAP